MRRFFSTLMIVFSGVALVLAMVGLYGLIAYSVAQRRVEIACACRSARIGCTCCA